MFPIRLLAAGAIAMAAAGTAHAQGCATPGGCGSTPLSGARVLFAPNKHFGRAPNANQPLCGPSLNPGTCYGYYPTKWRSWEEACPQGEAGGAATMPGGSYGQPPAMNQLPLGVPMTPVPSPLPTPTPLPPAKDPIPKSEFQPESAPAPLLSIPMPMISSTVPTRPAEHSKPAGAAAVLPLKTLPNVVVPPVRDFPERSRN